MDNFKLTMVPAHSTIQTVYGQITGSDGHPVAQRVMAAAVLFYEVCKAHRLEPSQMLDAAHRLTKHAEDHFSIELQALREYIRHEMDAP